MNFKYTCYYIVLSICCICCTNNKVASIKNQPSHILSPKVTLTEISTKKIPLDSITAPKAQYSQIFINNKGEREFTFYNTNDRSIYFYNYESLKFLNKIVLKKPKDLKGFHPIGYYIKTLDSIYVYNMSRVEIMLFNHLGETFKSLSLIHNQNKKDTRWVYQYPQYYPQTAIPFLPIQNRLLLPGQYISNMPESLIHHFRFIANIDGDLKSVNYYHKYPNELYGHNYNWYGGVYTQVFADLSANKDKLVLSFPVSHNLYIADLKSDTYTTVYGGSTKAGTIYSFDAKPQQEVSNQIFMKHFIQSDNYGAIKYDAFRKLYYRFLIKGIPEGNEFTAPAKKPVIVIIMDQNFKYLGETKIGTLGNWFLQNLFVTKEGLNIEYVGNNLDESFLILKTFLIKNKK